MLARLDQELAPMQGFVNREGSLLRVSGEDDPRAVDAITEIVESMGYVAQLIEEAPQVPRWFGLDEVDEMSQEEASILAQRWSTELGEEGVVGQAAGLSRLLESALLQTFREAARRGEIGTVDVDLSALRDVVSEDEARAVRTWIQTRLGHPIG